MANLTGQYRAQTYDQLLNLSGPVTTTAQAVTDGIGNPVGLEITSSNVNIATGFTFTINGSPVSVSDPLGFLDLTDPGADRIAFWDDSAGAVAWLEVGANLTLTGTTLSANAAAFDLTVAGDSGSTVIDSGDTLTIAGGTGITTAMVGDTLTVNQDTITSVGTITTGTWNADTIGVAYGGTGQTTYTNGQLLIGNTTGNTLTKATLTEGEGIDITNGTGSITIAAEDATDLNKGIASFDATDFTVTSGDVTLNAERIQDITGAMVTGNTETGIAVTYQDADGTIDFVVSDTTVAGDTGSTGITPGDTLTIAGGTGITTAMAGDTLTINQDTITSVGTVTSGTWNADTIGVAYGGTGQTTYTNGQLLIGNTTGNTLSKATLTEGTGLTITNGTGTITLATNDAEIDHDSLANFVANEHIDWTSATANFTTSGIITSTSTSHMVVPLGTTAQRPTPAEGQLRGNTSTNNLEYYDGTGWVDLTSGAGGGISNVVEDTTPQLGGDLDANGFDIAFDTGTGIYDENGNESLIFTTTASAVNYVNIINAATGTQSTIQAAGGDTNVGLFIDSKGTGLLTVGSNDSVVSLNGTSISGALIKDEDNMASNSAGHLATQQSIKAYVDANAGGGKVLQVGYATYTTYTSTSSVIARDDTIPQNTEGLEIMTLAFTPQSATSTLYIESGISFTGSAGNTTVLALFVDSTADALKVGFTSIANAQFAEDLHLNHSVASGSTTARTYKIRIGVNTSTLYLNGQNTGRTYGGTSGAYLKVTEVDS